MPEQGIQITHLPVRPDATRAERCEEAIDLIIAVMAQTSGTATAGRFILVDPTLWRTITDAIAHVSSCQVKDV